MPPHRDRLARTLLAGPGALITAVVAMAAMPVWLPPGTAGIDNLVFPLVLFPLIWAAAFFYACLDENLIRAAVTLLAATGLNGAVVAWAFLAAG